MTFRNEKGSMALVAIMGVFVLALIGGGYYFLGSTGGKKAGDSDARATYEEAVAALDKAMADPRSLESSLGRNTTAFACLYSSSADCRGKGGTFLLYQASGASQPVSQLARDSGLSAEGAGCRGFPSPACPIRVETVWEPVCAGERCEDTKSLRVKAKVSLHAEGVAPLEWAREELYQPQIQLSQAVTCERGGGVWANAECLTPAQASERQLASSPNGAAVEGGPKEEAPQIEAPVAVEPPTPQYQCPGQIAVNKEYYPLQYLTAERAQVNVPAMSCRMPGFFDVFVFQCSAKFPGSDSNEGQWVQVEAVMAPPCDNDGNVIGESPRL